MNSKKHRKQKSQLRRQLVKAHKAGHGVFLNWHKANQEVNALAEECDRLERVVEDYEESVNSLNRR